MTTQDIRLARGEREVGFLRQSAMPHMRARDIEAVVLSSPGDDPLVQRVWSSVIGKLPVLTLRGASSAVGAALLAAFAIVCRPSEREQGSIHFDDLALTLRDAQLRRGDELTEHLQQLCNESFGRLVAIVRQPLDFGH
jgi:hypothetical protein